MRQKVLILAVFWVFVTLSLAAQDEQFFTNQSFSVNGLYLPAGMVSVEYRLGFSFDSISLAPGIHAEFYIPVFGPIIGDAWGFRTLVDTKVYANESDIGPYLKMGLGCGFSGEGTYFLSNVPEIAASFYDQKTRAAYTEGLEYFCYLFTGGFGWNFRLDDSFFIDVYAGTNLELRLQPDSATYHGRLDLGVFTGINL